MVLTNRNRKAMKVVRKLAAYGFLAAAACVACGCGENDRRAGVDVQGEVEGFDATKMVISRVANQPYDQLVPLDTVSVESGHFAWRCDTLGCDVYALTFITDAELNDNSVYALLGDGRVTMKVVRSAQGGLEPHSQGSAMQSRYEDFIAGYRKAGRQAEIDSVEREFYAARSQNDTVTMAAIKESSRQLYSDGAAQVEKYVKEQMADSSRDFFTFFLYYMFEVVPKSIVRQGQIDTINQQLLEWRGAEVQSSRLMRDARERIAIASRSVEGAIAPELVCVDPQGDTLRLSELRGRRVLIDFWASYCSWCRLEMPTLRKAYEQYADAKGVTFLSVSIDKSRDAWLRAVEEEGMPWKNALVTEAQAATVTTDYNITGIPLILLLDEEGRIVRRGLRGEEISEVLAAL